jgi:dihydroorotase
VAIHDLVLRGGRVIDPSQGIDRVADVAFLDGQVSMVGESLDGKTVHDVTGHLVTPGLIDLHTHVYWGGTSLGVAPDTFSRKSAVTTLVDTGSAGPGNFAGFREHIIAHTKARILAYLNVSFAGIYAFSKRVYVGESGDHRLLAPIDAVEVADRNRDVIVGIKVRVGRHASGEQGVTPLQIARQVAERLGLPMMVHIDEPPPTLEDVLALMRPGDVLTHCFRPFPNTPATSDGRVEQFVIKARERGVVFDIGHGMGSFAFRTARTMLANQFMPDCISSDVHTLSIDGPAFDLLTTMSKFLCLGAPLFEVVRCATENPARALRHPELGTFRQGGAGDASVLCLENGSFDYVDATGEQITGKMRLCARGIVVGGRWFDSD